MDSDHNAIIFQGVDLEELIETIKSAKRPSDPFYKLGHDKAFLKFKLIKDFGVNSRKLMSLSVKELVTLAKEKMWESHLEETRVWLEWYGVHKSVEELKNLTELYLINRKISDISPLKVLVSLTVLVLNRNKISDVSPLKGLVNLKELYLIGNAISDVTPLKDLKNLTQLDLSHNKISDVSPLRGLENLTTLNAGYNNIFNASLLKELKNLTVIDLTDNKILEVPIFHYDDHYYMMHLIWRIVTLQWQ